MRNLWIVLLLCLGTAQLSGQITFKVRGWNVESGGTSDATIARQIGEAQGVDIWGLSEVHGFAAVQPFEEAAEEGESANFESYFGTTGGGDRLLIIYNEDRFELVDEFELGHVNIDRSGRAPLVVQLKVRETGEEFYFMVNHLFRGSASKRHQQSRLLNEWAESVSIPVIATGDYNYDWEVAGGDNDHDLGYDLLTAGNIFTWIRPDSLRRTQCSVTHSGGCRYNSVLDFVFTTKLPDRWLASSTIVTQSGDFPDDDNTSDHRAVEGVFTIEPGLTAEELKRRIRERITNLENELNDLKELLNQFAMVATSN